ncbi:putative LPS assembly protein LptD [Roseivirga sp. BDSF3-8]|uniref:putative LPS assembly protein LptD n=1 Tax=Roseivirga sp. BDSF3-8 TaxID=3241598 RepID=UPI003531F823
MRKSRSLISFIVFMFSGLSVLAQTEGERKISSEPINENEPDSVVITQSDVVDIGNVSQDTATSQPEGDIRTTIKYSAKDSTNMDLLGQKVYLYGDAKITYGTIELQADQIVIDYLTNSVTAEGREDSTGTMVGLPIFKEGEEVFEARQMKYNFKTRKAFISGVAKEQDEGYLFGESVKKDEEDNLYIQGGKFCPCDDPDASTYIRSKRIKLIPNDKVVTGPFIMYIGDVPTPLLFPFGMFPMPDKRASGIVVPTYGEERRRGFFLRNGGYYFAISDYVDLALTGEIYSKGSQGLNVRSTYRKRYKYNGNLNLQYNKQRVGQNEEDSVIQKDFWIRWSHQPQSRGTSRFSASVNAGTSSFNNNNPTRDLSQNIRQTFNSSVQYSKSFVGTPFNMSVSARHDQNIATGEVNLQLPELAVNMNRLYPFKGVAGDISWLEKLNIAYTMNATNRITNELPGLTNAEGRDSIAPFNFATLPELLENARNGFRHTIPVSTSLQLFKYFTVNPNFNYEEIWYLRQLDYSDYTAERGTIVIDTLNQFSRAYSFSTGASLNTRVYGTFYLKNKRLQAVRHIMIPSLSYSYRPDFSDPRYGFYQEVVVDSMGTTDLLSRYNGFVYGTPGRGVSNSLSFSVSNNIEGKLLAKNDTTGKPTKITLIDNLGMSASYNFAAEQFKLSTINLTARTRIFNNKLDINLTGTLDPYVYRLDSAYINRSGDRVVQQTRLDRYSWNYGRGFGQFSRVNLALGTSLNPKARENEQELDDIERENPNMPTSALRAEYVDFSIPWNLRLQYSLSYAKIGFQESDIISSVTFNGSLNITDKWKMTFNSGYDFKRKEFTLTNLAINRDLNCWQMRFNWTPFGRFQSYSLTVNIKSSILQDLKLNRNRSFWDQ